MFFVDRQEAGIKLSQKLNQYRNQPKTIVLAIPRGGVVIGRVLADKLNLPLDIVVSKKIGAPKNSELAIGAVDEDGEMVLNEYLVAQLNVGKSYLQQQVKLKKEEIKRCLNLFRRGKPALVLKNKRVILADDGIATGATLEAAINWLKKKKIKEIILAVPLASPESLAKLKGVVDKTIVISKPVNFTAVNQFYKCFPQVTDGEVKRILEK